MIRALVLTSLTGLALSACGPAPKGVGFTGVGSEPVGITAPRQGPNMRLAASQSVPSDNTLPLLRVNSSSLSQSARAAQALASGGTTSKTAKPVELASQTVMTSLAEVGGELYLVGRVPRSILSTSLKPGTDKALLGAVPQLTGCQHQGKVYRAGVSQTHPEALAIPLFCG